MDTDALDAGAHLSYFVIVSILQLGPAVPLGVGDVLAQLVMWDDVRVHLILRWRRSARISIRLTLRLHGMHFVIRH